MSSPRICYIARPDATPEAELNALVNVYAHLIRAHDSKRTAGHTSEHDSRDDVAIVTKQEGGESVGRAGATTRRRNDATKKRTKESKKWRS